ncbi:hypothetical protein LX36DRAFT_701176 [Colletotrichum falcatum]|nr:hypothetical protein LX36DRAFT_701176 [Colletotrichum falcatum]
MRSAYTLLVLLWSLSFAFAVPIRLRWREPGPSVPHDLDASYDPSTQHEPSEPNSPKQIGPPSEDIHDAAVKREPTPPGRTPLRKAGDVYNVLAEGSDYQVFTRYYRVGRVPIARVLFPKNNQVVITHAYTARETPHDDGTPRLHLSDIIEAVAKYHAHKSLSSINEVVVEAITNSQTIAAVRQYYAEWRAVPANKNAGHYPSKIFIQTLT